MCIRDSGHPGLHVLDGSAVSANPGVNPSLTITALSEHVCSRIPAKGEAESAPAREPRPTEVASV